MKVLILAAVMAAATAVGVSPAAARTAPSAAAVTGTDIDPAHSSGWPTAINDANQVVGGHDVDNETHGFVWQNGTVTDLGTLPGGDYSLAESINRYGDIVGDSGSYGPPGGIHAALWHGGTIHDLGTLGGTSFASAINSSGVIVGSSQLQPSGTQFRAVMWRQGVMRVLPTVAGSYYDAPTLLNDLGDAAGYTTQPSGTPHATLWTNGSALDLGLGRAVALNNLGQVLVQGGIDEQGNTYSFIWDHGKKTTFPSSVLTVTALNDCGQVAGTYLPAGSAQAHGFLWKKGVFTDLGVLSPVALNNVGQVIGGSTTTYGLAYAWNHGTVTQLLPPTGTVTMPTVINNNGHAVGVSGNSTATAWQVP